MYMLGKTNCGEIEFVVTSHQRDVSNIYFEMLTTVYDD